MASSLSHKGRTTVIWGADNIGQNVGNFNLATAICESAEFSPINERFKTPGSTGATKKTTLLVDGERADITFIYETTANSNVTFPSDGDIISLKRPNQTNASNYEVTEVQVTSRNKDDARIRITAERHFDVSL